VSNFLAVATATATLSRTLRAALNADLAGATVTTATPNPGGTGLPTGAGANLFLYDVTPNPGWTNADLPTRNTEGQLVERPRVAVDLHYLISFYGNEAQLEPQRLLGSALRTLHERPILTRDAIRATILDALFNPFIGTSDLADDIELVKLTPMSLSLEEMSKIWSIFFQTPYTLSIAYEATVVLIDSTRTPRSALPVGTRNVYVIPINQPVIERVIAQTGESDPIVVGGTILIQGQNLRGQLTRVLLGDQEVTPTVADISATEVRLPLTQPPVPAAGLRAGLRGVQVVHRIPMGTPEVDHRGFESNVAPVVLRPVVGVPVLNLVGTGLTPRSGTIDVPLNVTVGIRQRASLLLVQDAAADAEAFSFPADARTAETNQLRFTVSGLPAGTYFFRVQVDGAESPVDLDPASGAFGPRVVIP
jgi:Pvc16 N-terminal domain